MAVELSSFFEALAGRLYKENYLSDVTYALCQSDEVFKQFFLDFFFGNGAINVSRDKVEITRELSFDEGRPDFTIRVGDKEIYLVEVKIWNGSHHFAQYREILEKESKHKEDAIGHLGYIANYKINRAELSEDDTKAYETICDNGRTVKTWKDFACRLETYQAFNDPIIKGYLNYVRNVCPFDDFELPETSTIVLSDFKEIANFIQVLEAKIKNMALKSVFFYNSSKRFASQAWMGHFFELRNYNDEKSAWGWIGANYSKNGAVVCVEFENSSGWGEPVCEQFKNLPFNGDLRFYLRDKSVKWDVFFDNVIAFVQAKGESPCPPSVCLTLEGAARFESLLAMKSLPWLMDKYILSSAGKQLVEVNKTNITWSLSSTDAEHRDSESQGSHCGRYYILQRNGQRYIEFWLGVFYNNSLRTQSGVTFSEHPQFLFDMSKDDYERIKSGMHDKAAWYEIKEWNLVVCDMPVGEHGSGRFCDVMDSVFTLLRTIIRNATMPNQS